MSHPFKPWLALAMQTIPLNDLRRHNAGCNEEFITVASRVLDSGWYVLGENVASFEREFAAFCGVAHAAGVGNGTDALELALRALGVRAGDHVVTVANAGMYTASAVRSVGARPVFVDIDAESLCVDVDGLEGVIAAGPAAIVVTHLYGRLAEIERVVELASSHGIPVVEDCAQAHGASRGGRKAGSFGDIGCFSFYPTKNLGALGDGGAVVTSRDDLADRLRQLRQYGWTSKYVAQTPGGRNSRLDELQAAFLRVKLRHLDQWNAARRAIANRYADGITNARVSVPARMEADSVAHLYVVRTDDRDGLREHLRQAGVSSDVHYPVPDHRQPCMRDDFASVNLPNTEHACDHILTLPCFPEMTSEEVQSVVDACNSWQP
ncbi:DegT/DnrJ/EryC1/StrS family aminotransferase [Dokdonella sp. MW10]|uniref:DegT/DnrJ/EryC1/StrS family aminotransferase n=1 Tax=Dokdonella sp. MW10 TaxID=2992926 RepID=UPI003F813617